MLASHWARLIPRYSLLPLGKIDFPKNFAVFIGLTLGNVEIQATCSSAMQSTYPGLGTWVYVPRLTMGNPEIRVTGVGIEDLGI